MKIGIVCYPTYGGSGVVATELGIGLAQKGHKVHFISYKKPARLNRYYQGIVFHEVNSMEYPLFEHTPYETALASKLVDVIMNENLDILHVHYAIPHASVAYLARQIAASKGKNIPIVTTLHGTDITLVGNDPSYAPVVEFSINHSNGVTAVSNFLKEATEQHFNIKNDIRVIYNFVDTNKFKATKDLELRRCFAKDDEKILVHVSNFRKLKRVPDILEAFKEVRKQSNTKLLMIGDGPERKPLEEQCRRDHLCTDVHFVGKQDAVNQLLAISDIFLLPSANESFGLAALEAMACGLPVISSNAGGLPEVNTHGITGLLHDVGDVDTLIKHCLTILSDSDLYNTMSSNAKEKLDSFQINTVLEAYENYYKETIEASLQSV